MVDLYELNVHIKEKVNKIPPDNGKKISFLVFKLREKLGKGFQKQKKAIFVNGVPVNSEEIVVSPINLVTNVESIPSNSINTTIFSTEPIASSSIEANKPNETLINQNNIGTKLEQDTNLLDKNLYSLDSENNNVETLKMKSPISNSTGANRRILIAETYVKKIITNTVILMRKMLQNSKIQDQTVGQSVLVPKENSNIIPFPTSVVETNMEILSVYKSLLSKKMELEQQLQQFIEKYKINLETQQSVIETIESEKKNNQLHQLPKAM